MLCICYLFQKVQFGGRVVLITDSGCWPLYKEQVLLMGGLFQFASVFLGTDPTRFARHTHAPTRIKRRWGQSAQYFTAFMQLTNGQSRVFVVTLHSSRRSSQQVPAGVARTVMSEMKSKHMHVGVYCRPTRSSVYAVLPTSSSSPALHWYCLQ